MTGYEIKDRFIAGNVIEKAERIEAWMGDNPENERMPEVKQALEALKDAEPQRIAFEDLDFNFGERWIPTGVYAAYLSRLFDTEVKIAYSASMDEFSVVCGYRTMKITDEFLVKGYYRNYDGMHLLKHALHNTCPDMMKSIGKDEHGNDIKMRDSEGIQLANAKIDAIRNGFSEWLEEQSPQFKERLVTMYNRKFNCFVRPRYDGSHQTFPDLNLKGLASRGIKSCAEGDTIRLELRSDEKSKAERFPFDFVLTSTFRLEGRTVHHTLTVTNPADAAEELQFGIGYHPAFRIPFDDQHTTTDYEFRFDQPESPMILDAYPNGLLTGKCGYRWKNEQSIPLTDDLFENDSFCMAGLRSRTLGIYEKDTGKGIVCNVEGYPYTLIWSAPAKPVRFVCIEPWHSLPGAQTDTQEWSQRAAAACLAPGQTWETTLSTTFER